MKMTSSETLPILVLPSVAMLMIGPLRARTSSMLLTFFSKTESSGAMKTLGTYSEMRAMTPCFNSALGWPLA